MLTEIHGTKMEEVRGEWRRLHNEELLVLYCTLNILRMIRSRRVGHMARVRNAYRFVGET